jgi:hypothetical protein
MWLSWLFFLAVLALFPGTHATVYNQFNLGRHLVRVEHYPDLRLVVQYA